MARSDKRERSVVTLHQVAKLAGVHPATVSRSISPETRHLVNDETAERIAAAIAELGYRPNRAARSLKMQRSHSVGVVLPDLLNPVFPPIVRGIEDRLGMAHYTALLANTDDDRERERSGVEALRARQVDGFLIATARREDPLVAELVEAGVPVVLVNRRVDNAAVSAVVPDAHQGMALAVDHLAALGHRRIGHVAGPQATSTGWSRLEGFRDALDARGLAYEAIAIADAFTEQAGERAAATLLEAHADVTAIVAANDLIALGAIDALRDGGRDCPADVSVTGFNDMPFLDKLAPPLTSVHIPHYDLGWQAAELLLARIDGGDVSTVQTQVAVALAVRASTGPSATPRRRRRAAAST